VEVTVVINKFLYQGVSVEILERFSVLHKKGVIKLVKIHIDRKILGGG